MMAAKAGDEAEVRRAAKTEGRSLRTRVDGREERYPLGKADRSSGSGVRRSRIGKRRGYNDGCRPLQFHWG